MARSFGFLLITIDDGIYTRSNPPASHDKGIKHCNKYICELVNLLSYDRVKDYYNSVRVGWSLRNIDETLLARVFTKKP